MAKKYGVIVLSSLFICSALFVSGVPRKLYSTGSSLYNKIELFSAILRRIENDYVEEKDPSELIDSAIKGMVSDLDPHTSFLTSEEFSKWNQNFSGYSGIGITFDIVKGKITVMSVIKDGPSEKAGLKPGDRIIKIDGSSAIGLKRDEVPLKLMGPKGTTVDVSVERHSAKNLIDFTLTRDKVHLESIPYAFMIKPGIGYIAIVRFSATTGTELKQHLADLVEQGMTSLILDLRDNGGGYLKAAVDVSETFLDKGKLIVYTKGRIRRSFREFKASSGKALTKLPVTVLINHRSASASEIVSGALQDWDRAVIIGETSFGKGLVQSQYTFNDGSALLMVTARYYTPSGRLIQRPYNNKSKQEYYQEPPGNGEHADNNGKPSYNTKILGRTVYGGGGITPDYFLEADRDTISAPVQKLVLSRDRLLFTFTEHYINTHHQNNMTFQEFLHDYSPSQIIFDELFTYINKNGFSISRKEFDRNREDIKYFLKQNIADILWGDEERFKVQLLRDTWFQQSLQYVRNSKDILSKSFSIKKAG